ncbi:respiratory chain complex I subunit 1 family protein [Bacillus sp. 1NLA3E]|uniref:respiratory chain complex I subunit 1 family protein n=1 Tax=Bacillus sp. 1NLA3E TaxID=666686 RepID=UPI000247F1AA|nr:complex I subunit 1 family protein [Bacillus sp. 1NLA3E]AGK54033.1 NADH dehydrogenase (quinone) [Bacillus sp. 1NLA3E]
MDIIKLLFNVLIFPGGLFAIALSLLLTGVDRKVYARLQRRVGPPVYQQYLDIIKLSQKEILVPRTANFTAFRFAPLVGFAGMLTAIAIIPVTGVYSGLYQSGDLLVLLYLLALPALAMMIGASASGSPYSSVGLSREMTMMLAYEIPLVIVLLTVGMRVGMAGGETAVFSLSKIVNFQLNNGALLFDLPMLPALLAFLCCIPGTIGVVPFDIPEAETEITEGTILEYSGMGLAMFKLTGGLKILVMGALTVALFFPSGISDFWLVNLLWFILKCSLLCFFTITLVRATRARMRLDQAFKFYLLFPTGLALISLVLTLLSIRI